MATETIQIKIETNLKEVIADIKMAIKLFKQLKKEQKKTKK